MSARYRVALEGFGAFERRALENYFRLSKEPGPSFDASASLQDSDLCVVDSDHALVVDEVRRAGRLERTVFVGTEPPAGAIVHLGRPINPRQVARALETLLLALDGVADDFAPRAAPVATARAARPRLPDEQRKFPVHVVVFEDSDLAANMLVSQLEAFGCQVSVARHRDQALEMLTQSPVRMVFSDVHARADDGGLELCQLIKSNRKGAPSVVMMSTRVTSSDRVRAQLAGADAMLAKPIDSHDLLGVLRDASNRRRRAR